MVTLKKGDFVSIDYIGRLAFNDNIFDLTDEKLAKENKLHDPKLTYGALTICIGEKHLLEGLDEELEGKETESEFKVTLKPEQAFGKKNPKLIKIVSKGAFKKQDMEPYPGMQIQLGNAMATVKTVSGGRVIVDLNHPLAGRELVYDVKVHKKIDDVEEQVVCLLKMNLFLNKKHFKIEIKEKTAEIKVDKKVPEEVQKTFSELVKKLISSLEKVVFISEEQKQPLKNN
ncbi:MAG: FKBP-type peptidyl-prolyl cis-trans isomerase [Nanoarchaeota archaeon]|nr:FKBP-type peptidyl-prolyl cis-trans isomerase [Nanoarchaeota archaeon]